MQAYKLPYRFPGMDTLADRIKAARKHAQLTQRSLAEKVGVEQPVISQLETGKNLRSVHLTKIAQVCRVSPLWLSEGVGAMVQTRRNQRTKQSLMSSNCLASYLPGTMAIRLMTTIVKCPTSPK